MHITTETRVGIFVLFALGIFLYMSFYIGMFRFDKVSYNRYTISFNDTTGLEKKADVTIAGVKVGWVESVELSAQDQLPTASIMIHRQYKLYQDAHGIVRQEGMLGSKYLEINPGTRDAQPLQTGSTFKRQGRSPVSVDEILYNVQMVSEKMIQFSNAIEKTVQQNESNLTHIIQDVSTISHELKELIPLIQESLAVASSSMHQTTDQLQQSFADLHELVKKVNNGDGTLGKLINEKKPYENFVEVSDTIKGYCDTVNDLRIVFDGHNEFMLHNAEHSTFYGKPFKDYKNYLQARLFTGEDYFYLFEVLTTQKGTTYRRKLNREWIDEKNHVLEPSVLLKEDVAIPELIGEIDEIVRRFDTFKFGLQIGSIYNNIAFRVGFFENTAGCAIDVEMPVNSDKFRWISTFEAFDLKGWDRIDDHRPHLKWLNRLFFLRNFYLVVGADDFISKHNRSAFLGGGVRFCDDDFQYFAESLGLQ